MRKIKPPSKGEGKLQPLVRGGKKIGRNDKCPCGSGKKYKHCCLPREIKAQKAEKIRIEKELEPTFKRTKKTKFKRTK